MNMQVIGQIMNIFRKNTSPEQIVMNMMQQNGGNNPILNNAISMANSGNGKGLEQLARNLCKEQGIDVNNAISELQKYMK